MRTALLLAKTDDGHPLIHHPGILPGAQMIIRIGSAPKREILDRTLYRHAADDRQPIGG